MFMAGATAVTSCSDDYSNAPVIVPEGGIGSGAWDDPMTAYQVQIGSVNDSIEEVWAKGYIVGVVNTDLGNTLNERCAQFEGPFTVETNMLISIYTPEELIDKFTTSDTEGEILTDTRWEHVATVQLPSSTAARSDLNLASNEENIGKMVCLRGTVGVKYCGAYGVKSVSDYNWGEIGKEPVVLPPIEGPFWENFEATTEFGPYKAQGWKNVAVAGGLSGWYIKSYNGQNYITVSAYLGSPTAGPYENWLITPEIDLEALEHKTLEFISQAGYVAPDNSLEVYAMTSNDPAKSTNTKLTATIAEPPTSGYSAWVNSGKIDLSGFSGKIYIGWRYKSAHGGSGNSTTYCVDDINIGEASEPTTVIPDPGPAPSGGALFSMLDASATSCDWTFQNVTLPASLSYIWKWEEYNGNHYLNATAGTSPVESEAYAYSPAVSLAGVKGASVEFEHAAKFQTTIKTLCKLVVREAGTTSWTEYDIPEWPAAGGWKFAKSGKIDISAFDGKTVEIGFKYASDKNGTDKWEINNLKVNGTK